MLKKATAYRLVPLLAAALILLASPLSAKEAKNVILFIGDGMGPEQVKAGRMWAGRPLSFEGFPRTGFLNTSSAQGPVTDSAAAATAIATGQKVMNGVLSIRLPGDAGPLETVFEYFKKKGKSTGFVTTTYVTHATPAAFLSHAQSRDSYPEIARQYLRDPLPEVLMGGSRFLAPAEAKRAGYFVVTDKESLSGPYVPDAEYLAGLFGKGHMPYESTRLESLEFEDLPHLSRMVSVALDVLDKDPDGLFLMVEGGRIDHAGHANEFDQMTGEVVEFSRAVSSALEWVAKNPDTLIIVTADHETGGLNISDDTGKHEWSTHGHTATPVPVYSRGPGSERIRPLMDNTDIYKVLTGLGH